MLGIDNYTVCHMIRSRVIRSSNRNLHYLNCGHRIHPLTYLVFQGIHRVIGMMLRFPSSPQLQFQVESLVHEASMQTPTSAKSAFKGFFHTACNCDLLRMLIQRGASQTCLHTILTHHGHSTGPSFAIFTWLTPPKSSSQAKLSRIHFLIHNTLWKANFCAAQTLGTIQYMILHIPNLVLIICVYNTYLQAAYQRSIVFTIAGVTYQN